MKKLTIGRGEECDIRVEDPKGLVSRRHAILKTGNFGKYEITDVSKNGILVNGKRIMPHQPFKVSRKDVIVFANSIKFDWDEVPDHMKRLKLCLNIFIGIIGVVIVVWAYFLLNRNSCKEEVESYSEPLPAIINTDTNKNEESQEHPGVNNFGSADAENSGKEADVGRTDSEVTKKERRQNKSATTQEPKENKPGRSQKSTKDSEQSSTAEATADTSEGTKMPGGD